VTAHMQTTTGTPRQPSTELLDAALTAAARGWRVFPLRPDGKRPAFPDHTATDCAAHDPRCQAGHQGWETRATTDPNRIRRAWATQPFNVGIACGPSGLVVIDLDVLKPDHGPPPPDWQLPGVLAGDDVLTVLAERAAARPPFDTYTVRTGSGGRHLYFTAPPGVQLRNTIGGLGWLVDTRASGGYVVATGSTVNGGPYVVEHDTSPAPLPGWLTRQLTPPTPPATPTQAPELGDGRRAAYLKTVLTAELDRVTTATPGGRNHALFNAAHALGKLVAGGELPERQVVDLLTRAAATTGLNAGEISRTIASGLHTGANRPRSLHPTAAA
jgi:hypothetical protein